MIRRITKCECIITIILPEYSQNNKKIRKTKKSLTKNNAKITNQLNSNPNVKSELHQIIKIDNTKNENIATKIIPGYYQNNEKIQKIKISFKTDNLKIKNQLNITTTTKRDLHQKLSRSDTEMNNVITKNYQNITIRYISI